MTDLSARLTTMLALIPATFALLLACLLEPVASISSPVTDVVQFGCGVGTSFAVCVCLWLWRRHVRWSVPRIGATLATITLMMLNIVLWQPVVPVSGCGSDTTILCTGQSFTLGGLWLMVSAVMWWGTLLLAAQHAPRAVERKEGPIMTPNAARIVVMIAFVPLVFGIIMVTGYVMEYWFGIGDWRMVISINLCAILIVGAWWLLWRRAVEWTSGRRAMTVVLAFFTLITTGALSQPDWFNDGLRGGAIFFSWAIWLAGTAWLWRDDRAAVRTLLALARSPDAQSGAAVRADDRSAGRATERSADHADYRLTDRPADLAKCPKCGYSLAGLQEVRCPECGWASTVDDIVERSLMRAIVAE